MAENIAAQKRRGLYRIILRHCNHFNFPEAKRRKNKMPKVGKSNPFIVVSPCNGNEHN